MRSAENHRVSISIAMKTCQVREREREREREGEWEGGRKEGKKKRTVIVVVADDEFLELAVLAQLAPNVLVKGVKVVLQLRGVHPVLGVVGRVLVQVGHEDGLAVRGLDVLARAAVAVAAGADFEVEGAVDFVELGAEDGREEIGHGCVCRCEEFGCNRFCMFFFKSSLFGLVRLVMVMIWGIFWLDGLIGKNPWAKEARIITPQTWGGEAESRAWLKGVFPCGSCSTHLESAADCLYE